MARKTELTKEKRIRNEVARLNRIFKNMPKDRKDTARPLVANAAFMTITLEDLQETITREGVVSKYQNGENQWGTKKSAEVEVYNAMVKNHLAVVRQLCDLLPGDDGDGDGDKKPTEDELIAFVKKGGR